jgi:subtilisin-like proprotein convertase family protein
VFIGCGGGGADSTNTTNTTNYTSNPKTGIFADVPVFGLTYKTATKSGFTNEKGEYQYVQGEEVEFKLGDLSFGTVTAGALITPYTMARNIGSIDTQKAINIAVLLQSLDASRGGDEILDVRKLQNHSFTGINLSNLNDTQMTTTITTLLVNNPAIGDQNYRSPITPEDAKDNMDTYINNLPLTGDDPKRAEQWYLDKLGLNTIMGKRINQTYIQIVDDGFDSAHEDLKENYDESHSWNPKTNPPRHDPTSVRPEYDHGTNVAGIIGARGFNGIGIRGIAPYSKLVGYTFLRETVEINGTTYYYLNTMQNLEQAWVTGDNANDILMSNNSWGEETAAYYYDYDMLLKAGTTYLRDGKGRVYVMGAGNSRVPKVPFNEYFNTNNPRMVVGNSNLSHIANNQYVISVGALNFDDTVTYYSSQGSNLLVSAYAQGDIVQGNNGEYRLNIYTTTKNNFYSAVFNGTSASAPMVSGIVGLVLEKCPHLTYRDIKYLIATTSKKIDVNNPTWVQNNAGLWHSTDYGYGVINAKGMLDICENFTTLSPLKEVNAPWVSDDSNLTYANSHNGKSFDINVTSNDISKTEWVGVTFQFSHWRPGDLQITLTSPSGTTTELLQTGNALDEEVLMPDQYGNETIRESYFNRRLSSQAFYDENPYGIWKVTIADKVDNGKDGRWLSNIKLQIIGH